MPGDEPKASAQHEQEDAERAAALAEKKELSAGKPVKLFHPDHCAHEPEKQET